MAYQSDLFTITASCPTWEPPAVPAATDADMDGWRRAVWWNELSPSMRSYWLDLAGSVCPADSYSLRLPDALDVQARQRADTMGISLNSLICVALDAYLKSPDLVGSVNPSELAYPPVPMESVDVLLAKRASQPVQRFTARMRA